MIEHDGLKGIKAYHSIAAGSWSILLLIRPAETYETIGNWLIIIKVQYCARRLCHEETMSSVRACWLDVQSVWQAQ